MLWLDKQAPDCGMTAVWRLFWCGREWLRDWMELGLEAGLGVETYP